MRRRLGLFSLGLGLQGFRGSGFWGLGFRASGVQGFGVQGLGNMRLCLQTVTSARSFTGPKKAVTGQDAIKGVATVAGGPGQATSTCQIQPDMV